MQVVGTVLARGKQVVARGKQVVATGSQWGGLHMVVKRGYLRDPAQHQLELSDDLYCRLNKEVLQDLYGDTSILSGKATLEGTLRFRESRQSILPIEDSHYRLTKDGRFHMTSLGIGTYKGGIQEQNDLGLFNAVHESVQNTSINWRYMRSQRVVGAALKYLQGVDRDQIIIGAKVGLIPEDIDNNITGLQFIESLKSSLSSNDHINGVCLHPDFIEKSIEQSINNLKVECLDIVFMTHLESIIGKIGLQDTFKRAIEVLEKERHKGRIQAYGLSSWEGLRVDQQNSSHIELDQIYQWAKEVAGNKHGFQYIQVPVNVMMPESFMENTQGQNKQTVMQTADQLGLTVQTVSPLLGGSLINVPIDMQKVPLNYQSARHLQFIRSIGGVTSTIVGMKTSHHVRKNIEVAVNMPLSEEEFLGVFVPPSPREEQAQQPVDLDDLV